ncbi:MAG: glutamate-5-semialdehyde dehydrogenase [Planctomycetes bacterium]|nr:glutamate-5-semialdehyde dehydrogenase [Planctomycetota bacterium]
MTDPALEREMEEIARAAREAAERLTEAPAETREAALRGLADRLRAAAPEILAANAEDVAAARAAGVGAAKLDRLALDTARLEAAARGVEAVAALPDPVGRVADERLGPSGMRVTRVRAPIGVILMIYEARPNVTADAAALGLKAGNAVLLRGGSEAARSNAAIAVALASALRDAGLPERAVQVVARPEHEAVDVLLRQERFIDLVIPRGGEGLIRSVAEKSRIPVLKHYKGNCHVYVDVDADLAMAERILLNAKAQRPATCNAAEKLLVHEGIAAAFLPAAAARLAAAGVRLRGDERARALVAGMDPATEADWDEEYLDLLLAVKVVRDVEEAIRHINARGSRHTDAIVTAREATARRFLCAVDSASVLWNASTRMADGGEYGLGAEIGISTDKLHARGPMGVEELTCLKWVVFGTGQLRT